MFCSCCGEKITDDSIFCSHCGKKVDGIISDAAAPDQASTQGVCPSIDTCFIQSAVKNTNDTDIIMEKRRLLFALGWHRFIKSPLVLISLIVHSISLFFNFADIFAVAEIYDSLSYYVGDFTASLLKVQSIGNIFLNILLSVGMWMIYADGQSKKSASPSKNGLYLLYAYTNLYFIGTVIIFTLIGLSILFAKEDFGSILSFILFNVMSIAAGIGALSHWLISSILENTENGFDDGSINSGKIGVVAILMIILGSISTLSLITQFTLSSFFSGTFSVLIGSVMLSFKNTLKAIQIEQEKNLLPH